MTAWSAGRRRALAVLRGGAVALGILVCLGCSRPPEPAAGRELRWGRQHAMWARIPYSEVGRPSARLRGSDEADRPGWIDATVAEFARTLRRGRIRYVYVFSGPFRPDGRLPAYPFGAGTRRSFDIIRAEHPDAVLLPWVGGLQGKQLRLEDPQWVATAVDEVARLVDALGVGGVHVDLEHVLFTRPLDPAYPQNVNRFVRELRQRMPRAFISAVIPPTAPGVRVWKQQHAVAEVDELVALVDQLVFIYFDTSIQDPAAFDESLAIQVDQLARWKVLAPATQLLVAVGTFAHRQPGLKPYRNLRVESIGGHFNALARATVRHREQVVDGTAIYSEWLTDESEWARLRPFLRATAGGPSEASTPGAR